MRLTLHPAPDPAIRTRLIAMIEAFNDAASGRPEPERWLTIALHDAAGAVEGGLVGVSYYDWLLVEMLFVPEARRGQGLGTMLMRAAEAVAVARGCTGVWLDTGSPAAWRFYQRLGYRDFATLPDHPAGSPRHYMARRAPRAGSLDGLAIQEARDPLAAGVIGRGLTGVAEALYGPETDRAALAITAEDDTGPLGGLWMVARRGWLFLDLFILAPAARGGGIGARILAMAEDAARARFCRGVFLDTHGFQAPGFYRRQGYAVFGELPDHPIGHRRVFLRKAFADARLPTG
jgi:GNAT superfamily N-acetyltransferase